METGSWESKNRNCSTLKAHEYNFTAYLLLHSVVQSESAGLLALEGRRIILASPWEGSHTGTESRGLVGGHFCRQLLFSIFYPSLLIPYKKEQLEVPASIPSLGFSHVHNLVICSPCSWSSQLPPHLSLFIGSRQSSWDESNGDRCSYACSSKMWL